MSLVPLTFTLESNGAPFNASARAVAPELPIMKGRPAHRSNISTVTLPGKEKDRKRRLESLPDKSKHLMYFVKEVSFSTLLRNGLGEAAIFFNNPPTAEFRSLLAMSGTG